MAMNLTKRLKNVKILYPNFVTSFFRHYFQTALTSKQMIGKSCGWSHSILRIQLFPDHTNFEYFINRELYINDLNKSVNKVMLCFFMSSMIRISFW